MEPSPQAKVCVLSKCKAERSEALNKVRLGGENSPSFSSALLVIFFLSSLFKACSELLLYKVVALHQVLKRVIFRKCREVASAPSEHPWAPALWLGSTHRALLVTPPVPSGHRPFLSVLQECARASLSDVFVSTCYLTSETTLGSQDTSVNKTKAPALMG